MKSNSIVVAEYDYDGQNGTQLTFKDGDRIIVLDEDPSGWWTGRLEKNGIEGFFPSTFVIKKSDEKHVQQNIIEEQKSVDETNNNDNDNAEVDMNYMNFNYFANAQKIVSQADNFEGEEAASSENYYSAEVLNLKFNPNAKTRYGLASHYMSIFASIITITLSTSCFAWHNGSDWLKERKLANNSSSTSVCLLVGLYGFFGGILMLIWEYMKGDIRSGTSCVPWRCLLYFLFSIPLFFTLPSALCGVLWIDCCIMSCLAFKNGEKYSRKKKKSYSAEAVLSPKERVLYYCGSNGWQHIKDIFSDIKQRGSTKKYLFVAVYLLFNLIYILYWAIFYSSMVKDINSAAQFSQAYPPFTAADLQLISSRNISAGESPLILNGWFPTAKMFGNLLDINCAAILLPVCRSFISQLYNISSDQRKLAKTCSFLLSFMPLDKALQFHKLCAFLIVIGTILHTWAHFNHFASVPSTYEEVYGATVWISGSLIIVCMHFIYGSSFAVVRHGKYELFWYLHHLFVIFFISLLLHGANSWNPNFWKWFLVPAIFYILERSIRELRARRAIGVVSVLHMNSGSAKVFCLELEKSAMSPITSHQEGQYVFIKAPIISKLQWHPFTISSPPQQKTLTLHIRNMGDGSWTDRLQQFFQAIAPGKAYSELYHRDADLLVPQTIGPDGNNLICIDGPIAAPMQHLGEYKNAIIIGAGIGLTPLRATLQSIVYYRFKRGCGETYPSHAYCVWIVNHKQLNAYRFMCRTLKEAEDELFDQSLKNKQQKEEEEEERLLQCHIFVTSYDANGAHHMKDADDDDENIKIGNVNNDRQKDLALWGTHYDEQQQLQQRNKAPFSENDIWKLLKKPSQEATQIGHIIIHCGRPKWDEFFEPIQKKHSGHKIGVMFCGPNIIAQDLKKTCAKYTDFDTNTAFLLHKENF